MKDRLLLVEDNIANLRLIGDWLRSEGFEVDVAEDLAQARACIEREIPAVVLLDIRLGPEDGLDLLRWIRNDSRFCELPVVGVTAHAMHHEQEQILAEGCNGVISKPIDFRQLLRQLDLWIGASKRRALHGAASL